MPTSVSGSIERSPQIGQRRGYIDVARGLAVLLMILAHTTDAWTRAETRNTIGFRNTNILGGFAAPLFLWLAGIGVILYGERQAVLYGRRYAFRAVCRRGLEIFALAFLFRLQAFIVSPGSRPVALLRVDILNVMGPSFILAGVVWWSTTTGEDEAYGVRRTRLLITALTCAALATIISMATPIVRSSAWVDSLPAVLEWYLRPAGEHTNFTLFPWSGFLIGGAAVGALLTSAPDAIQHRRLQAVLAAAGVVLIGSGFYTSTLPTIYRHSSFWTSSPTWFCIRAGALLVLLAALRAIEVMKTRLAPTPWLIPPPLQTLGRASLFVYWIHVEMVYGYLTWPIHGRLPLWASLLGCGVFSALIYGAVVARDALQRRRRAPRRRLAPAVQAVTG